MDTTRNHRGSPLATTADIMLVQETLRVVGLYRGEIDGLPGVKTLRAVREYKKELGMAPNNQLDDAFIDHLRYDT